MFVWGGDIYNYDGSPTATSVRVANACKTYGYPNIFVMGNLANERNGTPVNTFPEHMIQYFHSAGLKTMIWAHSMFANYSLDNVKHQIDSQLAWGSSIDYILVDETDPWKSTSPAYYQAIANYIHSKGKYCVFNMGQRDFPDNYASIADICGVEQHWYHFARNGGLGKTDLFSHSIIPVQTYPQKYYGMISDWYLIDAPSSGIAYEMPPYAYTPIDEALAIRLTKDAWDSGINYFQVLFDKGPRITGRNDGLPDWWESYLSKLSGNVIPPGVSTVNITVGTGTGGTGTTNPSGIGSYQSSVTVTAYPASGSVFQQWDVYNSSGIYIGTYYNQTQTFSLSDYQYTIVAFFKQSAPTPEYEPTYVNILSYGTGSGTTNPPIGVEYVTRQATMTITAYPNQGSNFRQFDVYDSTGTYTGTYKAQTSVIPMYDVRYTIIVVFDLATPAPRGRRK